jgi:hypothetical protein
MYELLFKNLKNIPFAVAGTGEPTKDEFLIPYTVLWWQLPQKLVRVIPDTFVAPVVLVARIL